MSSPAPVIARLTITALVFIAAWSPVDAVDFVDTVVPESRFTSIEDESLTSQLALSSGTTLKAKVCQDGHTCTYHVTVTSTSKEEDNDHPSAMKANDETGVTFDLEIKPGTAAGSLALPLTLPNHMLAGSFVLDAKNYQMTDTDPETSKPHPGTEDYADLSTSFQKCFALSTREIVQISDGSLTILTETNPNKVDKKSDCAPHMQKIQNIYAGTIDQLAGVYASAKDPSLLEFSETVDDANGKRTTHYRREMRKDGSMTVHRTHSWELVEENDPFPLLMEGGQSSIAIAAKGKNHVGQDGVTTGSEESIKSTLGSDSPKTGFSCTGDDVPDANGKSCDMDEVPRKAENPETVRFEMDTEFVVKHVKSVKTSLAQDQTLTEFLQHHAVAGRKPVPVLKAMRAKPDEAEPEDPLNPEEGVEAMVEVLEQSKPADFEPGPLRKEMTRAMESPKIRALTVAKLAKNEIKNGRAVQSLMHAIGKAATRSTEAVDQLIELGSNPNIDEDAQSQALVALLQARCWDHDYAIRGLSKLANPKAQSFIEIMALHVQHGLISHAEHCANNKYTAASANKYHGILSQSREALADAAANQDDAAVWILLDAIGNTNSQSPHETASVAAIANNNQLSEQTRLLAVRTLGRLYTPDAVAALQKLSSSTSMNVQTAVEKALSGEHMAKSDARRPPPSEVKTMALPQSSAEVEGNLNIGVKREKVWPMPADKDIRAEPKVGVELYRNNDKNDKPFCLHGYAGVDGKAWTWTISLIQAGGQKCAGYKFYQYLSILNIVVWSKQRGSGKNFNSKWTDSGNGVTHPNTAQFSQAGDQQGYCGMNVDAMDLVAQIAYDHDFLDKTKYMTISCFVLSGQVILNGEVGLKVGWGNMGDPNGSGSHKNEARCKSGEIVFAIPYAQATLTGELALDLAVARGGGGVNVILVKFSLPATSEKMVDSSCGGIYLKVEALGGKVYGFIDLLRSFSVKVGGGCWYCFWRWEVRREWSRKWTITFYEWSSPATWTSNELTCDYEYTQRKHLFCDSYGYDGNQYRYSSLAAAKTACNADNNCGGIKQWTCGSAQYGLCGKSGYTLRNYGHPRCVYTKNT